MLTQDLLSPLEARLWDDVSKDDRVDFDGEGAEVRAVVICQFLLGIGLTPRCRRLNLRNTVVSGEIDLQSAKLLFPIKFRDCKFGRRVKLQQAHASAIAFVHCTLAGIAADQLRTTFNFVVRDCSDSGGIELRGAHIGGHVDFRDTELKGPSDNVLTADGLVVGQDMRCDGRFRAEGRVRLVGAHIGGQFLCENGKFRHPGKIALDATGLVVGEEVYWHNGFRADGCIRLSGARLDGRLDCTGGQFRSGRDVALQFDGLRVAQDVTFGSGSLVHGMVDLTGCRIGGKLDLTGAVFRNAGKTALDLARASVAQNLICRGGFEVRGRVLLAGAEIGGNLWCEGGKFENATGDAIDATGITVHRDVKLSRDNGQRFHATGSVVLSDANIGGTMCCTGGVFINPGGASLTARGLTVTRDVLLGTGFDANGLVDLMDSTVGGKFSCAGKFGAALHCDRITVGHSTEFCDGFEAAGSVSLSGARITVDLELTGVQLKSASLALTLCGTCVGGTLKVKFAKETTGPIDLSKAKVGQLDDVGAGWPAEVRLDDFVYRALPDRPGGPDARSRLAWLRRNPRYVPQIYLQLASVYQAAGLDAWAGDVYVAGEDARRQARTGLLGWAQRLLGRLSKATVRYGYRPLQVLYWLLGLEVVGIMLFHGLRGQIRPRHDAPGFNSVLYTLDLLVPVVNLKQRDFFVAHDLAAWFAAGYTLAGWGLALALGVGVSRIFKTR